MKNEQNKSLIKQNILHYLEYKHISKYEFYKKTKIARGTLDNSSGITEGGISNFIAHYPDVNLIWLITGNGEMFKSNGHDNPLAVKSNENGIGIPLIPAAAMAGLFNGELNVLEYECERFVVPTFKGAEFLISVRGSSMYPKYNSGDIVACKRLSLDTFFQWNKVYVLDTDQGALIKRVRKASDPETILVVSENPQYDSFELHRSQLHGIAVVIGVIRLE